MKLLKTKIKTTFSVALLVSIILLNLPANAIASEGDNPIENHWVEAGIIHIEHTINETHESIPSSESLSSDAVYENPSLITDELDNLWLSYSDSGIIYISKQNEDSHFKTVSAISGGYTLSEHHYLITNGKHVIVAEAEDKEGTQGIGIFTSTNGIEWTNEEWISDSSGMDLNNPWLTKAGAQWILYWDQSHGLHNSLFYSISGDLSAWGPLEPVFNEGTHSSHESHPTSIYTEGVETLVWTTDKFDNHEYLNSDVEKTLAFSQRTSFGDWTPPQPIRNQFGIDENPTLALLDDSLVVVWDSDRSFHTAFEGEGKGHGGTNIWYSTYLQDGWSEPAVISIEDFHKKSPSIAITDNLGIVVVWEETSQIHITHTLNSEKSVPILEGFENKFSLSPDSITEEIHIHKQTRIDRNIEITNEGDFTLRGEIDSTNGLTISHHLIELLPGQSMTIQVSVGLDPLDDFHGVIIFDTNAGIRKVGINFHTTDTNTNQINPLEEVSDSNYSGIRKVQSAAESESSGGAGLAVFLVLMMSVIIGIAYKKNKDKNSNSSPPKAIGIVAIMVLMSLSPIIQNTQAQAWDNEHQQLEVQEIYNWEIFPDQDFNLSWPVEAPLENLTEITLTSKEYSDPPLAIAQFQDCWDHCDQRLWELEILKQELSYDRWIKLNFEIKGSVESFPFIVFQHEDKGSIEYYNLSQELGGINGEWQQIQLNLQEAGSFLSRGTGNANMYLVSPILEFDNPYKTASLVIKTLGQDSIPHQLNSTFNPLTHKLHYNSGNSLTSSKMIDGDIINLIGSVDRFPVASFPTISNTEVSGESLPADYSSAIPDIDFDLIVREYENYKWFDTPVFTDNPSSGWQECGNGGFLCPSGGTLNSEETFTSSSPFVDSDWRLGTYDLPYSKQYMFMDVEYPAPQIQSVMLNADSDPNGNRLVSKDDPLTFDVRIMELYQGLSSLTFEATVVDLGTQQPLGVIGSKTVTSEQLLEEYGKAVNNEPSGINFTFKPSDWYYPLEDDDSKYDIHDPVFLPYHQYALVVTYADKSLTMPDGTQYALGKWGITDDGKNLVRDEILGTIFVIQPGPVVTDTEVILPSYSHLNVNESDNIFILNAKDAVWDGVQSREYSTNYFTTKLIEDGKQPKVLDSTLELEMLINSDIQNPIIINTHGPILPAPESYFLDNQKDNGYLGEWDFETFIEGEVVDQSHHLNHGTLIGGQRSYDAKQGKVSLFLNESSNVTITDSGASVVYELSDESGNSVFCVSNDGTEPDIENCQQYENADDAQLAKSTPLYPVEMYRVSMDMKFLAPHEGGEKMILSYGNLSDDSQSFWDLTYDAPNQKLSLYSNYLEHENQDAALVISNVREDVWYALDLVFDELGLTIYLNSEQVSDTALWANVGDMNEIKQTSITGFEIAKSDINILIDDFLDF